jgi:hypothetical protein
MVASPAVAHHRVLACPGAGSSAAARHLFQTVVRRRTRHLIGPGVPGCPKCGRADGGGPLPLGGHAGLVQQHAEGRRQGGPCPGQDWVIIRTATT